MCTVDMDNIGKRTGATDTASLTDYKTWKLGEAGWNRQKPK